MASQPIVRMSEEEYLAFERRSEDKHEFLDGEVYAMSGARRAHVLLESSLNAALHGRLSGRCEIYSANMRVGIPHRSAYFYPDLSVACGKPDFRDGEFDTLTNPILVVEILSPSTKNYDRGAKFERYRSIESLRHYVIVHPDERFIEHYSLGPDGRWVLDELRGGEAILDLTAVGASIPLAEIYRPLGDLWID